MKSLILQKGLLKLLCQNYSQYIVSLVLWQPLVTKTNSNTSNKSLSRISSGNHKRTQQGVSAVLESYLYKLCLVCATNNYTCPYVHTSSSCQSHVLLKATMLHPCILILSSRSFYHVLGLWCHIMWHVMWLQCHVPLHCSKSKRKRKQYKIRKIK